MSSARKRKLEALEEFNTVAESPKRPRLTQANLRKLNNKMGGSKRPAKSNPSKSNRPESSRLSASSEHEGSTARTVSTRLSTTAPGFANKALANGVLDPRFSRPATNIDDLRETANRQRETASPSESEYRAYIFDQADIDGEDTTVHETIHLLKRDRDQEYGRSYNQSFVDFPKNVGFNDGLSPAQPDYVEGPKLLSFQPFRARDLLGSAVTRPGLNALTLPHFAGEFKAPGKDLVLGQTQAGYDGACLVYMRDQANSFLETPDPPNYAAVTTFVTDGAVLRTYAHYSDSSTGQVEYHQTRIHTTDITGSYDDYKKGRRWLRNLQDLARKSSCELKDRLVASTNPPDTGESDECDDDDEPSNQLLSEYNASFSRAAEYNGAYAGTSSAQAADDSLQSSDNQVAGMTVARLDEYAEDYLQSAEYQGVSTNFAKHRIVHGVQSCGSGYALDDSPVPVWEHDAGHANNMSPTADDNAYSPHTTALQTLDSSKTAHPVTPPKSAGSSSMSKKKSRERCR